AGPYCTRLLGDLGARVIKIERPGEGDEMRRNYLQLEPRRDDQSSYFARVNAGKESVGVDMSRPEGQVIIRDLAKVVDVVVENFMPGVVTKLRCDYETLRAVKPDIIYCSISGFGQTGPWRSRPAFAHIINAASGLMHLEQGDEPAPRVSNLQAADVLAATHAATVILSALTRRGREAPRELARAPADRRVLARALPDDRGRGQDAVGGAYSVRPGPATGRGDRGVTPGGPALLPRGPASGARRGACDREPVSPRRRAARSPGAGGLPRRGAHARGAH